MCWPNNVRGTGDAEEISSPYEDVDDLVDCSLWKNREPTSDDRGDEDRVVVLGRPVVGFAVIGGGDIGRLRFSTCVPVMNCGTEGTGGGGAPSEEEEGVCARSLSAPELIRFTSFHILAPVGGVSGSCCRLVDSPALFTNFPFSPVGDDDDSTSLTDDDNSLGGLFLPPMIGLISCKLGRP
jgi:hypothetical protein